MAGNVNLIDPMEVVSRLPKTLNGTPDYEKMFIFAELTAERRGRSVLTFESTKGTVTLKQELSDANVTLMGVDFNDKNDIKLTTKWTDNTTNSSQLLEGFGITNIKVKVTSSFVPTVTIEFVDIRGMTFYNLGSNSPYSILIDFPPPIFNLTLKGYYGRALTYQLHLVKSNTRFESNTGNFYTTVEFVARTFSPLTDVPFKYIDVFPFINQETKANVDEKAQPKTNTKETEVNPEFFNPNASVRPRNTNELIKKLQSLYDDIAELKNTSEESEANKTAITDKTKGVDFQNTLNNFQFQIDQIYRNNAKIIIENIIEDQNEGAGKFRIATKVNEFDTNIQSDKTDGLNNKSKNSRLYLAVKNQVKLTENSSTLNLNNVTTTTTSLTNALNVYRQTLLRKSNDIFRVDNGDIGEAKTIYDYDLNNDNVTPLIINTNNKTEYVAIDITGLYIKLYKYIGQKSKDIADAQAQIVGLANQAAIQNLGMKPTLYNIFEILCNDVDTFYNKLRYTTVEAEKHHTKYSDLILGDSSIKDTKIGAFPLYISANTTAGVTREARAIPIPISERLANSGSEQFPEIRLVDDFIRVFIDTQKSQLTDELKTQEDAVGNNVWIPSTPVDSALVNPKAESPYLNLEFQYQDVGNDDLIQKVYNKIIERFYISSQYSYGRSFYEDDSRENIALVKLLAGSEASNLASSLVNPVVINNLIDKSKVYGNRANIDTLFNEFKTVYAYNNINPTFLKVGNNDTLPEAITQGDHVADYDDAQLGTQVLIRNRSNENFEGFKILKTTPTLRNNADGTNATILNPVDKYLNREKGGFQKFTEFLGFTQDTITQLTKENIPFFPDAERDDVYRTKFLNQVNSKGINTGAFLINWSYYLEEYDSDLKDFLNNNEYSFAAKAFFVGSNFFRSRSYFDDSKLTDFVPIKDSFTTPCAAEIPFFTLVYMGGLINYNIDATFKAEIDKLLQEDFVNNNLAALGITTFTKDIDRVKQLATLDSSTLWGYFKNYINEQNNNDDGFLKLSTSVVSMIDVVINSDGDKQEEYEKILNNEYYIQVTERLMRKYVIIIFSEYTFANELNETDPYQTLATTNTVEDSRNLNEIFFVEFFSVLSQSLKKRDEEVSALESELSVSIGDNDIKTQLYYSFKSISDKWIAGLGSEQKGFPLNEGSNDPLINKFVFVDRAMNPIGKDCIINVESLLEAAQDFDVSVFTVMSKLLSLNGFEFFPLQNFMVHSQNQWEDSFRIFETANQQAKPAFVCMYIGGTSTTLNNPYSDYDDDGADMDSPPKDYNARVTGTTGNFPYSQVKAFRVGYSEQNQSFFTDIQLDTIEHTETNESLAILSKIANDESKSVPVPKAQNLFSVYENRSYSTTVNMLGNMMIQPTQYFQLENIPMFSGAYLILDVEHNIVPNHMTTSFHGVRIREYPNPIVTEFSTSIGIQGGSAQDLSGNIAIDRLINDPLYEAARKNGIVGAIVSGVTPTTWSNENNAKISTLHPLIREDVANLINVLERSGFRMTINSAFRSYDKQRALRADYDARLAANPSNPGLPASKAGNSFHNFGLAIDMGLIDANGNYVSSANNKFWSEIGEIAEKQGFRWGGRFSKYDPVHFEKTLGYGYVVGDNGKIYDGSTVQYAQNGTLATLREKYENNQKVGEYVYL